MQPFRQMPMTKDTTPILSSRRFARSRFVFRVLCTIALLVLLLCSMLQKQSSSLVLCCNSSSASNDKRSEGGGGRRQRQRVAIVGGGGHAGSFLTRKLLDSNQFHKVVAYDMNNPHRSTEEEEEEGGLLLNIVQRHSSSLTVNDLSQFDVVIFLGGCTGQKACAALSERDRYQVQVMDVLKLAQKMTPKQLLLVSSTGAVLEGRQKTTTEHHRLLPSSRDDLDEYSASMLEREEALRLLAAKSRKHSLSLPQIHMLRFGTLVGISPAQRTDLLIPSLFRSAYTKGVLEVHNALSHCSFLSLNDMARAVQALVLSETTNVGGFHIWNLASFNATVLKVATTVASLTEATLDVQDVYLNTTQPFTGFTMDSGEFECAFNFEFQDTLLSALDEFDRNVPESIIAKGPHAEQVSNATTIPCPVCGATGQQPVLDLNDQPLVDDNNEFFLTNAQDSLFVPRFPLKLVRCRVCNHYHLSQDVVVPFTTNATHEQQVQHQYAMPKAIQQFEWLAQKITSETETTTATRVGRRKNVLEIGCNDGSQLDQFRKLGWNTFGVEPVESMASLAQTKNHTVHKGVWPLVDFPNLPRGDRIDAIVVTQNNLLANVRHPTDFLRSCANAMDPKTTKLYILTSQCNMRQQEGWLDALHHGQLSFFTGHSFLKAAELAGLYITSFETTSHTDSCLLTMERNPNHEKEKIQPPVTSSAMAERLELEIKEGMTTDFFGEKLSVWSHAVRDWMTHEVSILKNQEMYTVGAYGATASSMALLHFILDGFELSSSRENGQIFDWVLDDAPAKQNTYCPGTSIPILATDILRNEILSSKPLAIVALAWDSLDDLIGTIQEEAQGQWESVLVLTPFPKPQIILVEVDVQLPESGTLLREMVFTPTLIPNPMRNVDRRKALMITHQKNEEVMFPFFIVQNAPHFDQAILIDYNSTDRTRQLLELYAPPTWSIVNSKNKYFQAFPCDAEVVEYEAMHRDKWVLALTVTEHLVHPLLRSTLFGLQQERQRNATEKGFRQVAGLAGLPDANLTGTTGPDFHQIYHLPMRLIMGDEKQGPLMYYTSLIKQRHVFGSRFHQSDSFYRNGRFLHYGTLGIHEYGGGRHFFPAMGNLTAAPTAEATKGFIAKFVYSPFPEVLTRMTAIAKSVTPDEITPHLSRTNDVEVLHERRKGLQKVPAHDLCDDHGDMRYWDHRQAFRAHPVRCSQNNFDFVKPQYNLVDLAEDIYHFKLRIPPQLKNKNKKAAT